MHERSGVQHEGKLPTEVFLLGALRLEARDEPDKSCVGFVGLGCAFWGVAMLEYCPKVHRPWTTLEFVKTNENSKSS